MTYVWLLLDDADLSDHILWTLKKQAIKLDWISRKSIILQHNLKEKEGVSTCYPDPTLQWAIRLHSIFCKDLLDRSRESTLRAYWKESKGFSDFVPLDFENLQ